MVFSSLPKKIWVRIGPEGAGLLVAIFVRGGTGFMVRLRVRELAEERGIGKAKLSRLSDLSIWTIRAMWSDPGYDAGIQTLAKVARALNVCVIPRIAPHRPYSPYRKIR